MAQILKACVVCGTASEGPRCPRHAKPPVSRHRVYCNLRDRIVAASTVCGICGQPLDNGDQIVVDHRLPRAHGGSDDAANLQAAHKRCNAAKSGRLPSRY